MEDGFKLQDAKIAIVGLGLMGGSLALAMKGKCAALYGIDSDPATLRLGLAKQIVDKADSDPAKLLQVDLVILATPVPVIMDLLHKLPSFTDQSCVVLDLGSTKSDILQAMDALPERFDPIGGHPICGKEKLGLEHAERDLYRGAPFVVTALERTTLRAREAARQILSAIGARPIEMTAEEHDRALGFTSHLPFLVASALALAAPLEYASLTGTGFRSTSRLAGTPSSMTMGILQSNRGNILKALSLFQQQLAEIQAKLAADDFQALAGLLDRSRAAYQALTANN